MPGIKYLDFTIYFGNDFTHLGTSKFICEGYHETKLEKLIFKEITTVTRALMAIKYRDANSQDLLTKETISKANVIIKKSDISIAKNYLKVYEIKLLGLLVEQYLAFAETMAQQRVLMYMKDWISRLDIIFQLNGSELLTHADY